VIDPANFTSSTPINNPFFPLPPGMTFVYEGQTAEGFEHVKSLSEPVTVQYGSYDNCLKTEESSSLAPGDVENKFYAANVGNLLTIDMATNPPERSEVVSIVPNQE